MLISAKELRSYVIRALDGEIGNVHGFLFDDQNWFIRYLVVDIGSWLPGWRVLISPFALGQPEWGAQTLLVELSKEQVENSPPPISAHETVSRQMEAQLHSYYGWRPYWIGGAPLPFAVPQPQAEKAANAEQNSDPHLRSTREVIGYHMQATDGEIGHVEDFVLNDHIWTVHYMVVDTRNWLPGRKVILSTSWIEEVDWIENHDHVNLSQEAVENSPEFDPSVPVNREYEIRLYDYYGRPKYWVRAQSGRNY